MATVGNIDLQLECQVEVALLNIIICSRKRRDYIPYEGFFNQEKPEFTSKKPLAQNRVIPNTCNVFYYENLLNRIIDESDKMPPYRRPC